MGLEFKTFNTLASRMSSFATISGLGPIGSKPKTAAKALASPPATSSAVPKAAHVAAPKAASLECAEFNKTGNPCKRGNGCRDDRCRNASTKALKSAVKGGDGGAQVAQLSFQVNDLKKELASMKAASAATDARLDSVEGKVTANQSGIDAILGMMKEDRTQRALQPPPSKLAIMPPSAASHRSPSPLPKMKLITSGPEESFGKKCGFWVPEWQSSRSTPARVSSGQNGWADMAGSSALVASSGSLPSHSFLQKPKKEALLPSPSSLLKSRKESAGMSGSGLVRCYDPSGFINMLREKRWVSLLALLQSKGADPSNHFLTAAVNAFTLSQDDEPIAVAIACFDRARSAYSFDPIQQDCISAAFNPENLVFKEFCIRMADYCSKKPEKGIEFCSVTFSYAHLAQNDQHRKEIIADLAKLKLKKN